LFGLTDQSRELSLECAKTEGGGRSFVRFQQKIGDIPVFGGELIVQTDSSGGVVSVSGKTSPHVAADTTPSIDSSAAAEKAFQLASKNYHLDRAALTATTPELWIYNPSLLVSGPNVNKLVWRVEIRTVDSRPIDELVLVDAHSGGVALHFNQTGFAKDRRIYDDNNTPTSLLPGDIGFPGVLARSEGDPATADTDVDNAYDYAGLTYDFYSTVLGRDSIDNLGMQLISTVRYCDGIRPCPLTDVYWDTTHEQMVYGAGYASALDIVAHEMTHGVTQHTSRLFNYMQSGAVSESLSDVFGKLVELTAAMEWGYPTPAHRWWIGQSLPNGPLRDMQNATIYDGANWNPAPDRMTSTNYSCSADQGTYSHFNSAVNNKAAYLMVDGSSAEPGGVFNGKTVTGLGTDKVAKIYYEAQTNLLTSGSDYQDLYYALQLTCENLTGSSGITAYDCLQVKNAVDAVEMNLQLAGCAAPEAPLCGAGLVPKDLFSDNFESGGDNWTHSPVTGFDTWNIPWAEYATSGVNSIWGQDLDCQSCLSESYASMNSGVTLPSAAYLHFRHAYDFEAPDFDGGVVEYSTDGGATWTDAGTLIIENGYSGTLAPPTDPPDTANDNPFAGRSAFVGTSNGYMSSRLDLSSLSGQNVKFRFGIGTDSLTLGGFHGWYIDDFRIYTCVVPVTIDTSPGGLQVVVDSSSYQAPYTFGWDEGSSHNIGVATTQPGLTGIQYVFASWSDGGLASHTITVSPSVTTYTASFTTQYNLTTAVSPSVSGTVSPDCSSGCWYTSGESLPLTAAAGGGYVFTSWSGDCSGADLATSVLMDGPKTCTANFCTPADIGGTPEDSLQIAFNKPSLKNDDIIKVVEGILTENTDFDRAGVSVLLRGGYDCAFSEPPPASSYSTLQGSLTVTNGAITVENLIIK